MTLPECQSRRTLPASNRLFFCAHPRQHSLDHLVSAEVCDLCRLREQSPPEHFRPFDPATFQVRGSVPCFFLGDQTGWKDCPSCQGHVRQKVFRCLHPLHPETTLERCGGCADYMPALERSGIRSWAVGVLANEGESGGSDGALDAGWPQVDLLDESHGPAGTWFARWSRLLSELVAQFPGRDGYLVVSRTGELVPGLRPEIEREALRRRRFGVLAVGGTLPPGEGPRPLLADDAAAYAFPRAALETFLGHPVVARVRRIDPWTGTHRVDPILREWAEVSGLDYIEWNARDRRERDA